MSLRAVTALVVDLVLATVLVFVHSTHAHLTFRTKRGDGAIVPHDWVYIALICAMVGAIAWWVLGILRTYRTLGRR